MININILTNSADRVCIKLIAVILIKIYIGQIVNFNKRFKNHSAVWENNKLKTSNLAKNLLECGQA